MRLRDKLTYANVVATLALFFAMTGSAVYAADHLKVKSANIAARAVKAGKIAPKAVKRNKIASGAVGSEQLADGAVTRSKVAVGAIGAGQIEDSSIELADLRHPVGFVASPVGGTAAVSGGSDFPYPLSDNAWNARAGQFDVVFGQVDATLTAVEGDQCNVWIRLYVNGSEIGGGQLQSNSATPQHITAGLGGEPRINFDGPTHQTLTATLNSHGCAGGTEVERTRIRILGIG